MQQKYFIVLGILVIFVGIPSTKAQNESNCTGQIHERADTMRICRETQYYDFKERQCKGIPGGGYRPFISINRNCPNETLIADPKNKKAYLFCTTEYSIHVLCPTGYEFSKSLRRCSQVPNYDELDTSTTENPTSRSSSPTSPIDESTGSSTFPETLDLVRGNGTTESPDITTEFISKETSSSSSPEVIIDDSTDDYADLAPKPEDYQGGVDDIESPLDEQGEGEDVESSSKKTSLSSSSTKSPINEFTDTEITTPGLIELTSSEPSDDEFTEKTEVNIGQISSSTSLPETSELGKEIETTNTPDISTESPSKETSSTKSPIDELTGGTEVTTSGLTESSTVIASSELPDDDEDTYSTKVTIMQILSSSTPFPRTSDVPAGDETTSPDIISTESTLEDSSSSSTRSPLDEFADDRRTSTPGSIESSTLFASSESPDDEVTNMEVTTGQLLSSSTSFPEASDLQRENETTESPDIVTTESALKDSLSSSTRSPMDELTGDTEITTSDSIKSSTLFTSSESPADKDTYSTKVTIMQLLSSSTPFPRTSDVPDENKTTESPDIISTESSLKENSLSSSTRSSLDEVTDDSETVAPGLIESSTLFTSSGSPDDVVTNMEVITGQLLSSSTSFPEASDLERGNETTESPDIVTTETLPKEISLSSSSTRSPMDDSIDGYTELYSTSRNYYSGGEDTCMEQCMTSCRINSTTGKPN